MDYCTLDDLRGKLPDATLVQLTDDGSPDAPGSIQSSVAAVAITSASTKIDAYIGVHYPLPLSTVPNILREIAADLAIFNLYARVRDTDMPEAMVKRNSEAVKLLELIMSGKVSLGLPTALALPRVGMVSSAPSKTFSDRRLSRMDVDQMPRWWP